MGTGSRIWTVWAGSPQFDCANVWFRLWVSPWARAWTHWAPTGHFIKSSYISQKITYFMYISSKTWKTQQMKNWAGGLRMARIDPSRRPSMFNFKDMPNELRRNSNIRKQLKISKTPDLPPWRPICYSFPCWAQLIIAATGNLFWYWAQSGNKVQNCYT